MGQMKDILYKALKSIFYNIHQPVIITSSLVIAITGRPERNNAFIWLQQIHKFILFSQIKRASRADVFLNFIS